MEAGSAPLTILMVGPDISTRGGVQSYARSLLATLRIPAEPFAVGRHRPGERLPARALRIVRDSLGFSRRLKRGDVGLVHLNTTLAPRSLLRDGILLLVAARTALPVVVFIHGWSPVWERIIRRYGKRPFRWVFGKAAAIIVLARAFERSLRDLGLANRIIVESTFVDEWLCPASVQDAVRRRGGDPGTQTILFLSRILREKGIFIALDAFALLQKRLPGIRMVVAGDGPALEEARGAVRANEVPGVTFCGYLDGEEKRSVLERSDLYILPTSYGEGMPISVIEAMAWGLAVVARPVGGLPDVFTEGEMGFLTPSLDPAVFADILERLIRTPELRVQIARVNATAVQDRFLARSAAGRLERIYRETLDDIPRRHAGSTSAA